jgi:thiol-disulfide isomerase/thioredoxin
MNVRVLLFVLMTGGCVRIPPALPIEDAARHDLVPKREALPLDFTLKRYPSGATYRLAEDRGAVVLIDVWATWCEPCRESLQFYQSVAEELGARGFKIYAVSIDADAAVIAPFIRELKLTLPILHDPEAAVTGGALMVKQTPTSFLIDRRGVVRRVREGLTDESLQQTRTEIERLLAESVK